MICDSIADLLAASISSDKFANVLGYYDPGDGGGGDFYWDSSDTISVDNGGTIFISSTDANGRWKRLFSGPVNVRWFGAVGNGNTDDTNAIQKALAYNEVFIPAGQFVVSDSLPISSSQHIFGCAPSDINYSAGHNNVFATYILVNGTNIPFRYTSTPGNNSTLLVNFRLFDLEIKANTGLQGFIDINGMQFCKFTNLKLTDCKAIAVQLQFSYYNNFEKIWFNNCFNSLYLTGALGSTECNLNTFSNLTISQWQTYGIFLERARGNIFSIVDAETTADGSTPIGPAIKFFDSSYNTIEHYWTESIYVDFSEESARKNFESNIIIDGTSTSSNKGNIIRHIPQSLTPNIGITVSKSQYTLLENVRIGNAITGIIESGNSSLRIRYPQIEPNVVSPITLGSNDSLVFNDGLVNRSRVNTSMTIEADNGGYQSYRITRAGNIMAAFGIDNSPAGLLSLTDNSGRIFTVLRGLTDGTTTGYIQTTGGIGFLNPRATSDVPTSQVYLDNIKGLSYKDSTSKSQPIALVNYGTTAAIPITAYPGQQFYDITTQKLLVYNGTAWIDPSYQSKGATTNRPTSAVPGFQYFDTTVGRPLWWNGTAWVDSGGTVV